MLKKDRPCERNLTSALMEEIEPLCANDPFEAGIFYYDWMLTRCD